MGILSSRQVMKTQTTIESRLLLHKIAGNGVLWLVTNNQHWLKQTKKNSDNSKKKWLSCVPPVSEQMEMHNSKCYLSRMGTAFVLWYSQTRCLGSPIHTGILRYLTSGTHEDTQRKMLQTGHQSRALTLFSHRTSKILLQLLQRTALQSLRKAWKRLHPVLL